MNLNRVYTVVLGLLLSLTFGCASSRPKPTPEECGRGSQAALESAASAKESLQFQVNSHPEGTDVLILSGGGRNGAFGAGVLAGWRKNTELERPDQFDVVTAISTGALLGTFAYLGDKQVQVGEQKVSADEAMKLAYTTTTTEMVLDENCALFALLFGNSLNDAEPFHSLMKKYIPDSTIQLVADESRLTKRKFFVGTANLDCGTFMIWDMGEIAESGDYDRYRQILTASAAVPGIFPPVEIDGFLHVDGGTREQLFLREVIIPLCEQYAVRSQTTSCSPPNIYIIVNGPIGVLPDSVDNRLPDIALRSIALLMDEAMVGNLFRVWHVAKQNGANFRATYVTEDIRQKGDTHDFDPKIMKELYDDGYRFGEVGSWKADVPVAPDQ